MTISIHLFWSQTSHSYLHVFGFCYQDQFGMKTIFWPFRGWFY